MSKFFLVIFSILASSHAVQAAAEEKPVANQINTISEWVALPEVKAQGPDFMKRVEGAWTKGSAIYGFRAADLPFNAGNMEHQIQKGLSIPVTAKWSHESDIGKCVMTVKFKADGSYASSKGGCIPRR